MGTNWAKPERAELSALFRELGPDAPTLCGDWTTRDLAAHLVLREARPDGAAGIVFGPLSGHTQRLQDKYAARPYDELVNAVASGPPLLSPFRLPKADEIGNTSEYFVHLEDVRRAQRGWQPRDLSPEFRDALWNLVKTRASALMRKSPVGIDLVRTDSSDRPHITVVTRSPVVTVTGEAPELLLYAFGRKGQCLVELSGDPQAVAQVRDADFSV